MLYHLVPSWNSLAMLMKFMQEEHFSGGRISCSFQMKTDKIKCFPEKKKKKKCLKLFYTFSSPVHVGLWVPECCRIRSEHLGDSLADISQMTEPTEKGCWKMWEPLPAWGKMALCSLLINFLFPLAPIWSSLGTKEVEKARKGKPQG